MKIPVLYSLAQVAEQLHVTPRRLKELPQARALGRKIGRQVLFTESDVLSIIASLPTLGRPIYVAKNAKPAAQRAIGYAAHTSDPALIEALKLANEKRVEQRRRR